VCAVIKTVCKKIWIGTDSISRPLED